MLLSLTWASGSAAWECPSFSGQEWEFTGHLVNRIYPGPPDYESVTRGDEPVTRWYLQLPWPVCFAEHKYLARFQLALTPQEAERYRRFLGKRVRVSGALIEGTPGRYTTSLAMTVSSLIPLDGGGS